MIKKIVIYMFLIQCIDKNMWILPIRLSTNDRSDYWNSTDSSNHWCNTEMWKGGVGCECNCCPLTQRQHVGEGQVKLKSDL